MRFSLSWRRPTATCRRKLPGDFWCGTGSPRCAAGIKYVGEMEAVISFLSEYRLTGLTVGIFTFLIIGLFHPLVIKAEYWFGTRSWWMFLVLGIAAAALSVCVEGLVLSILFGVVAFSSFWSILEVFQQRERVRKGWFPENPRRKS